MSRIQKVRDVLKSLQLDAIVVAKPENRRYVSGFTGTAGVVVITLDNAWFLTDFRYQEQAELQCKGFNVVILKPEDKLHDWLESLNLSKAGFEADFWTVDSFEVLKSVSGVAWLSVHKEMIHLRTIKDQQELDVLARAAAIGDKAFEHLLGWIKPGMKESEVALELEFFMRKKGASALSFDSIVASGLRSSMPHGVASDKVIETGDLLTLDFGCVLEGYCSDMTRTIVLGKATQEQKQIYEIVLEAQLAGLAALKPGEKCVYVDKVARDIIDAKGFGAYFGHGLGHGVGLEIHEQPRLAVSSETILEPNMVVTVEPGIYVPELGGVRIEDLVAITETGYQSFTHSPKQLIEL